MASNTANRFRFAARFRRLDMVILARLSSWPLHVTIMILRPPTIDELVANFLSGEDCTMADGLIPPAADPEAVWSAVLRLMQQDLSADQISLLAAGPIEDLLALHGKQMIDRIEVEARRSPAFAHVLGGVWRRDMPPEIWQRVESVRSGKVW